MSKHDIVIVDNNESVHKALSGHLRKAGFSNIHFFSDPKSALEKLIAIAPGLILAEVNMENIDGWQLCKIIRSESFRPFNLVPVILYSTTTQNPDSYQIAGSVGASAFIQHPFSYEDIMTLVYTHYISPEEETVPFKPGYTKKIVVADDDSNILNILEFCLEENGYTVKTATNGKEATECIELLKPQVVLLDYQMPVMDGMDVLKWVKREHPDTGVVVLTAHGSEKTAISFMKEGADDYIRKPFDIKELPEICEMAFKKYSIRQNNRRFKEKVMALKDSEAKYRGIVDNSSDLIYTLDENGNFKFINKQGEILLKYTLEEICGKPFENFMLKEDVENVGRQFFERRTGNRAWKRFEVRLISKDCENIELEVNAQGLYSENLTDKKHFAGTLGIGRDISERNKMQERLIQADKLSSIGTLVSGVAHEINNPLTSIMGFTEELLSSPGLSDSNKRDTRLIYSEAQRCIKIVQNLLMFARKHHMQKKAVSVNEVVHSTIDLLDFQLTSNNIKVNLSYDKKNPAVFGNSYQLQQVFLNILNNSSDAMYDHRQKGNLTVSTYTDPECDRRVTVKFANDGPSLEKNVINKIFDPFFTTKTVGKGTGLGLSIAHGIITKHKGTITAENITGGVAFYVQLPLIPGESDRNNSLEPVDTAVSVSRKKVLLAEDNEGIQELMARIFSREGHDLKTTLNGEEALQAFKSESFDLVVSDFKMPIMDGMELYENITRINPGMKGRFILMTGMIGKDLLEFAEKREIHFLQKPFKRSDFNKLLTEIFKNQC